VAKKGDEKAMDAVLAALEDEDADMRRAAIASLSICEGSKAVDAVIAKLDHKFSDVRRTAIQALVEIVNKGDSKAIQALMDRQSETNADVRSTVIWGLEKLGKTVEVGEGGSSWRF